MQKPARPHVCVYPPDPPPELEVLSGFHRYTLLIPVLGIVREPYMSLICGALLLHRLREKKTSRIGRAVSIREHAWLIVHFIEHRPVSCLRCFSFLRKSGNVCSARAANPNRRVTQEAAHASAACG